MKLKKIPPEYFIKILDHLTRLTPASVRFRRVFDDIVNKFSSDTSRFRPEGDEKISLALEIINSSLPEIKSNESISYTIKKLEDEYFYKDEISDKYLNLPINYSAMLDAAGECDNLPKNVMWLKHLNKFDFDLNILREKYSLLYPVKKILLCEGKTEDNLLNSIFSLFNINLDKMGIMVIAAGGKNQVARKYYEMTEYLKIPFFILLDKDALQTKKIIENKLRMQDKIYILNCGEFEDLIPHDILKNAINYSHIYEQNCSDNDFSDSQNSHSLDLIYKKYGFGEFKKGHFSLLLKEYIEKYCTKEDFVNSELADIINDLI